MCFLLSGLDEQIDTFTWSGKLVVVGMSDRWQEPSEGCFLSTESLFWLAVVKAISCFMSLSAFCQDECQIIANAHAHTHANSSTRTHMCPHRPTRGPFVLSWYWSYNFVSSTLLPIEVLYTPVRYCLLHAKINKKKIYVYCSDICWDPRFA